MPYQLRELTVSEVLDQAVALCKNHFRLLVSVCAVIYLPASIVLYVLAALLQPPEPAFNAPMEEHIAAQEQMLETLVITAPVGLLFAFTITPITAGALIHAVAKEYLGEPTTLGASIGAGFRRAPSLIGLAILTTLAIIGGMLLLVIPAIIVSIRLWLGNAALMVENAGVGESMRRSWTLVKGSMGKVFILLSLVMVINFAFGFTTMLIPHLIVQVIADAFVDTATFMFMSAALVVMYFSLRCQKEEFDLVRLVREMRAADRLDDAPELTSLVSG